MPAIFAAAIEAVPIVDEPAPSLTSFIDGPASSLTAFISSPAPSAQAPRASSFTQFVNEPLATEPRGGFDSVVVEPSPRLTQTVVPETLHPTITFDPRLVTIPRKLLYAQAALILIVGAIALGIGYWMGRGDKPAPLLTPQLFEPPPEPHGEPPPQANPQP